MKNKTLRIIVVEPNKKPYVKDVEDSLQSLQKVVGGNIEIVYLPNENRVVLVCNETGKLEHLKPNWMLRFNKSHTEIIVGTFFLVATREDEFDSLTYEEIAKYNKILENGRL